jgi:hypothetical protein
MLEARQPWRQRFRCLSRPKRNPRRPLCSLLFFPFVFVRIAKLNECWFDLPPWLVLLLFYLTLSLPWQSKILVCELSTAAGWDNGTFGMVICLAELLTTTSPHCLVSGSVASGALRVRVILDLVIFVLLGLDLDELFASKILERYLLDCMLDVLLQLIRDISTFLYSCG